MSRLQAIIAGDNELALQLAGEKSMIGCILLERYEEAQQYTLLYDDDTYVNQSFISVARGDEEMLKKSVESAIKQIRKEARMDVTLIDEYSLAALILARKRGMNFDIHVAEIPEGLLEDTPLDYESLKLPIPEHVQELLKNNKIKDKHMAHKKLSEMTEEELLQLVKNIMMRWIIS